jgi:two-component system CheB/CheR fusion protein
VESTDGRSTYLLRVKPYRALTGGIEGAVITLVDITDRKRLERERVCLAAIVEFSQDAIISHDLAGIITSWNLGAASLFGYTAADMIGQAMTRLLPEQQIDEWPANLERLRTGQSIASTDIRRLTKDGRAIDLSLAISPIRDARGEIRGASVVARDITERRLAEERNALLMAELDHRVKNILAVVSVVVSQTLKAADLPLDARDEIEGRITAIARAQGQVSEHGVEGPLQGLIATELSPYQQRCNITMSGQEVLLTSKASLILALAIHELATNAAKYGALSVPAGELAISWEVTPGPKAPLLTLLWEERGGPIVIAPTRRGFGTKLIELSLTRGLGAEVQREFLESGVQCRIRFALADDLGRLRRA